MTASYNAGVTVKELGEKYGIHRGSISKHLRRRGTPIRKVGLDAKQIEEAARIYAEGKSVETIGRGMVSARTLFASG
ncbi:hypothetical protein [Arthrobacter sp. TB 23]|uniref:hypothetical protein n=1 Tax=Arthrobacter sp. TB 23 TaxID=494419 RepID=UPI0002D7035C|nr:hypothetical protein [Arthrobacter sp. TB 23]